MNVVGRLIAGISGVTSTLDEVRERYALASFSTYESGTFLAKGIPTEPPPVVGDTNVRAELWQLLEKITQ
jgi:hypothetical protein